MDPTPDPTPDSAPDSKPGTDYFHLEPPGEEGHSPRSLIGLSHLKAPITVYWYGEQAEIALDTLFIGAFHGDEPLSTSVLTAWQAILAAQPLTDVPAFAIIPALNPDGLMANTRTNFAGVDLNRNWPTHLPDQPVKPWKEQEKGTPYYSGKTPASEPETQALLQFLTKHPPKKIVSVHTPYRVVNYDGPAPISEQLAEAMGKMNGYPAVADIGYPTPGSFGNYAGNLLGIPTITLELPEDDPFDVVLQHNLPAFIAALRFAV